MTEGVEKNVHFIGHVNMREEAIGFVDRVLKEKGNFEDFKDLSGGLDEISSEYRVEITDDEDSFAVTVEPLAGSAEKFVFIIDKGTGTLYRPLANSEDAQEVDDEDMDFLDDI